MKRLITVVSILALLSGTALPASASEGGVPGNSADSAVGVGTSFDHVDRRITSVILPLQSTVEGIFDYYVDPERIINTTGVLEDGVTEVTANEEGVYFAHTDASTDPATVTYHSTSETVLFEGRNSVDVDVSVRAQIVSSGGGKDIRLVTSESDLEAVAEPALLLTLRVGDAAKPVPLTGTTVRALIAGIPDNFSVQSDGTQFVYDIRTDTDVTPLTPWNQVTLTLSGKTNEREVPDGTAAMTAPQVELTWSIIPHDTVIGITDCTLSQNRQFFYLALPDEERLDLNLLTSVTAAQGSTINEVATPAVSSDARYIIIPWEQMKTGILMPGPSRPGVSIQFEILYNGYTYTCSYAGE